MNSAVKVNKTHDSVKNAMTSFRYFYCRKQLTGCAFKKGVLKNFAKFTGKHLVLESLF